MLNQGRRRRFTRGGSGAIGRNRNNARWSNGNTRESNKTKVLASFLTCGLILALLLAFGVNLPTLSSNSSSSVTSPLSLRREGDDNKKHRHRNKNHRVAIIITHVTPSTSSTKEFPPYFPLFLSAAEGSSSLVDFLIFHDGVPERSLPNNIPSNVHLINLGSSTKMAEILSRVSEDREKDGLLVLQKDDLIECLQKALDKFPYIIVEFKSALGFLFQDYIQHYTHWGYADLDIAFGDLPRWITHDELVDYDIVTYGFGDQDRLYLRGQFTFHKNNNRINQLWKGCKFLSEIDDRFRRVFVEGEQFHFESAEGCYSQVVLRDGNVRVKYAVKAFTDVKGAEDTASTHGIYIGVGSKGDRSVVYKAGNGDGDGMRLMKLDSNWFEDVSHRYGHPDNKPLQWEVGPREIVRTYRDLINEGAMNKTEIVKCMYWAPSKYQKDICALDVSSTDTVFLIDGTIYKQRYEMTSFPANIITYPFFHFQEWKRYYRASQLAPLNHAKLARGWVLTKEGILPRLPPPIPSPHPPLDGAVLDSHLVSTSVHMQISEWINSSKNKAQTDKGRSNRYELPSFLASSTIFCLRSSQKKFPPQPATSQCDDEISWNYAAEEEEQQQRQQRTILDILKRGKMWDTTTSVVEDVTLAMTLQITSAQLVDANALDDLLDVAESNMAIWSFQPCILLLHVAGATEEVRTKVSQRFQNSASDKDGSRPYLETSLVAAIFSTHPNNVSRKALMNMAVEAAPTRWVITGLELERGLILSKETSVFAKRAAKIHGDVAGNVLWIPQFAAGNDFTSGLKRDSEGGLLSSVSAITFLDAYEQRDPLITDHLSQFDCLPCDKGVEGDEVEERIINLWWDLTKAEILGDLSQSQFGAGTDESLNNFARYRGDIEISLTKLLSDEKKETIKSFDKSPILMIDMIGPRNGMVTSDLAPEVDGLGGQMCYNFLRIAQLAALGYRINVLQGSFAVSVPSSRDAICNSFDINNVEKKDIDLGSLDRCNGCFMFDNKELAWSIARDEKQRPAKGAVLWNEHDAILNGNGKSALV